MLEYKNPAMRPLMSMERRQAEIFFGNNVTSDISNDIKSEIERFDNRETRMRSDKLAPFRDVWER